MNELNDGTGKSFSTLSFELNYNAYTVGKVINGRCNGVKQLYKITLDNGHSFRCTDNHMILTRGKKWKTIKDGLSVGELLMPLRKKIISITLDSIEPVYDIEVEKYHNFALSNGVIVHNCAFSGSIGAGKTQTAVVALCYLLYKLLCLKDPIGYYQLNKNSEIVFAFINITLDRAYGVAFGKMQRLLLDSPWFLAHGDVRGSKYKVYYPSKRISWSIGANEGHVLGGDVFAAIIDEVEFAGGTDRQMEKSKIMRVYRAVRRRMDSRFMKLGKMPGILFLVSSKKSEYDFLEQYIQKSKNRPYFFLADDPQWVVKPQKYCGETFKIAIGNKYMP